MIRFFRFVLLVLLLSTVYLISAIVTMRFAIHGAEVRIPDFRGETAQQALERAADLGLPTNIENRLYSADVPVGRILQQSPAPGTIVRREWHLRLTESLGPQRVNIPDLIGKPERPASIQLRRLGLDVSAVAHMPDAGAAPDIVIAQDPPAEASGIEKPSVSLLVADAAPPEPASFVMPNFIGQQFVTAEATLRQAGLQAPAEQEVFAVPEPSGATLPGTVIGQNPMAGARIAANQSIELRVAH